MKVLLTGSTGMVGKNILEHASAKDYEILTPTSSDLNLLVIDEIEKFMLANKPECIIHAAGLVGGIHANINRPFDFLANNLLMGLNLVTIAKKLGIKKFLNLGSSCMYPKNFEEAIPEKALLTGELEETNEGYAIAKIAVAKACEYISRENSNYYYKTIIPCNLYGKYDKFGDDSSHMIPAVIKKIHHAKVNNIPEIEIWGDGNSRREFMYAEDLADLVFYIIPKIEFIPNMVNAGLGYDYTVNDYYKIIAEEIGYTGTFFHDLTKPTGMKRKLVDISLLNKIGWSSHFNLRDGIRKTYNYYLENQYK